MIFNLILDKKGRFDVALIFDISLKFANRDHNLGISNGVDFA